MILDHLAPERVVLAGLATSRDGVLAEVAGVLAPAVPSATEGEILEALRQRERVVSTGVGHGVAMPHARMPVVSAVTLAFVRYPAGIEFAAMDGLPVRLVFGIVGPPAGSGQHVKLLACLARLVKDAATREELRACESVDSVLAVLRRRDASPAGAPA